MLLSWVLPLVSVNPLPGAASMLKARDKNVAICARVAGLLGQYRNGAVLQPVVTPRFAR